MGAKIWIPVSLQPSLHNDNDKFTLSAGVKVIEQTQDFGLENEERYKNSYSNINPELNIAWPVIPEANAPPKTSTCVLNKWFDAKLGNIIENHVKATRIPKNANK